MKNLVKSLSRSLPQDFESDHYNELSKEVYGTNVQQEGWRGATVALLVEKYLVFVRRSKHLSLHPAQVAFLGGHREPGENTPWEVAAREFEEETSLSRDTLQFVGHIPPVYTANKTLVVPSLATSSMSLNDILQQAQTNGEWDMMFAVPWERLIDESTWVCGERHGETSGFLLFRPITVDEQVYPETPTAVPQLLWGATARMVWNLLRVHFNVK